MKINDMAYIKIYSKTEIDTRDFIPDLRFDYKCEDTDSMFYPDPTYEYIYDSDSELLDDVIDYDFVRIAYATFIDNLHWIYGRLDAMGIVYRYALVDGEHIDINHPKYKEGNNIN